MKARIQRRKLERTPMADKAFLECPGWHRFNRKKFFKDSIEMTSRGPASTGHSVSLHRDLGGRLFFQKTEMKANAPTFIREATFDEACAFRLKSVPRRRQEPEKWLQLHGITRAEGGAR